MYIEPSETHIVDPKENKLNFTWKCTGLYKYTMNFQLNFTRPVDISSSLPYDTIFFVTNDTFIYKNLTLSHNIKP